MSTWLVFALLGVGTGALYGVLAIALILAVRGSGVVNFAVGAMATVSAVVYAELRSTGDLVVPVVVIPSRYSLFSPLGLLPAAAIALAVGLAVAAIVEWAIFRRLRTAPPVASLVATVGLTTVLQGLIVKNFGDRTMRTPAILPDGVGTLFGRRYPVDRIYVVAVVVVLAIVVIYVYRATRFGLATRAAFLSAKGATLLGLDTRRLARVNWLIAALLAGVVGIIATSLGGVNPFSLTLYVVPAFAAALAARMHSFSVAVVVAIGIGMFEALAVHLVARRQVPTFLLGGFSTLVPFIVVVVALVARGKTMPDRSLIVERASVAVPISRPGWRWLAVIGPAMALVAYGDSPLRFAFVQSVFVTTLLLSIVVLTGFVGQVSLAQLSFAGFAAFMLSRFDGLPFPLAPLAAIALTTVVGTLVSIPALRVRGILFAVVSYATAVVFDEVLYRSPTFVGRGGLATVAAPSIGGIDLGVHAGGDFPSRRFALIAVVCAALCAWAVAGLRRGSLGRRMLAVRANERAAAAAGIDVPGTKITAATIASAITATAGVMFAYKAETFTGQGLSAQDGLQVLALAYVGGIGSIAGAVIGGLLAPSALATYVLTDGGSSIDQYLLTGLALIAVTVVFPAGLAGLGPIVAQRWRHAMAAAPVASGGDTIEIETLGGDRGEVADDGVVEISLRPLRRRAHRRAGPGGA